MGKDCGSLGFQEQCLNFMVEFNFEYFSMSEEDKENVKVSGEFNEDDVSAIVREDEEDGAK